jgi:hypothetical protein
MLIYDDELTKDGIGVVTISDSSFELSTSLGAVPDLL